MTFAKYANIPVSSQVSLGDCCCYGNHVEVWEMPVAEPIAGINSLFLAQVSC
jgi:hypothetical protein